MNTGSNAGGGGPPDPVRIPGGDGGAEPGNAECNRRLVEKLLVPIVYDELRMFARRQVALNWRHHDIEGTDLVHEVVLRIIAGARLDAEDPAHLMAIMRVGIRRLLIDRSRRQAAGRAART